MWKELLCCAGSKQGHLQLHLQVLRNVKETAILSQRRRITREYYTSHTDKYFVRTRMRELSMNVSRKENIVCRIYLFKEPIIILVKIRSVKYCTSFCFTSIRS